MNEDQLHSSDDEEYRQDIEKHFPDRPSKRNRTNTSKEKAPRKKYVKGKQGGLQGIMEMPLEVFMEIAHHVHPGDLISLIRTSKFFRAMLLNKSATLIWQRALSNVPRLPPCPMGLVGPQYAALMFSKYCTLCGALATGKPDPFLQVRLCPSCRETELEETVPDRFRAAGSNFVPWTMNVKRNKKSMISHPIYCLLPTRIEVERKEFEFVSSNDGKGLAEWRLQRQTAWDHQSKEGKQLLEYLNSATASRLDELKDLRSERREQIHGRLRTLGWEDKYFYFHRESAEKQWKSLVEVSKPLTDRAWTNMLPKLIQLLDDNQLLVDEYNQQQRRHARATKAQDLLRQLRRDTHPYQPIVDALQLKCPPLQFGSFLMEEEEEPGLSIPFPLNQVIRAWDFFVNLCEEENSTERVEELFNEQRNLISQKLLDWRAQVEDQLVEQYKSTSTENTNPITGTDTILTIQGSTDPTKYFSDNARFLLRADTVFMLKTTSSSSEVDQEHGSIASSIHFPDIPCIDNDLFYFDDSFGFGPYPYEDTEEKSLDCYVRHAGKEAIIKALLRDLQMPDVAHVELVNMGKAFVCGRCIHSRPMEWNGLVEHYHSGRRNWIGNRFIHNTYETRHPVIFRNPHDLEPGANPKPLVRIAQSEDNNASPYHSLDFVAECVICRGIDFPDDSNFESLAKMREHMLEMHDIADPIEEFHFANSSPFFQNVLFWTQFEQSIWEQKWDSLHDAPSTDGASAQQA